LFAWLGTKRAAPFGWAALENWPFLLGLSVFDPSRCQPNRNKVLKGENLNNDDDKAG
jgi:hypothetical protein